MLSSTLRTASRMAPSSLSCTTTFAATTSSPVVDIGIASLQVRHRSNRSRRGMYDGKDVRSGNNVSFSERKTKRRFKPNLVVKRVYSEVLDEMIRFHMTAATLRSMDKVGGLDNYLLQSKHVTDGEGLKAKKRVLERLEELEAESTSA